MNAATGQPRDGPGRLRQPGHLPQRIVGRFALSRREPPDQVLESAVGTGSLRLDCPITTVDEGQAGFSQVGVWTTASDDATRFGPTYRSAAAGTGAVIATW